MMPTDLRHYRLSRWQRLELWLDGCSNAIQQWLDDESLFGLSRAQIFIIFTFAVLIGLDRIF